jgi:transcription antitermination factor NusG
LSLIGELFVMSKFKVGDRVKILPGTAIPFVGVEGTIYGVQPHDGGITTMDRHIVVFERREKRSFYSRELQHIEKVKK